MNKQILIIATSAFLLSCTDIRPHITTNKTDINVQQTNTTNVKYTCSRNTKLSVNFTSTIDEIEQTVAIINGYGEQSITLPKKTVASGFLYSNGKYTLRGKGDKASWTVGRMAPFQCSVGDKLPSNKGIK